MKTAIGPNVLRIAREQQRLARERAQREREVQDERQLIDDSVPVFDRGNDPLIFALADMGDDE